MKNLILIAALFFSVNIYAQDAEALLEKQDKKLDFNLTMGSELAISGDNAWLNNYLAPNFNYRLSQKFSFTAGMMIYSFRMPGDFGYTTNNSREVFTASYVSINYHVNEKLTVSSSVIKTNPLNKPVMNANALNLDYSVEARYKITPNLEIGVQFSKRNYMNPMYPYQQNINTFDTKENF